MKTKSMLGLLGAALALCLALPGHAQDIADPDTRRKISGGVADYYEKRPAMRPTAAWLEKTPAATCAKPRLPRAMEKDEIEGTTILSFQIGADGKPINARVARSSGWAVLDEAALESLALCDFNPAGAPEWQNVSYRFYLD